jgi:hypothetical protein
MHGHDGLPQQRPDLLGPAGSDGRSRAAHWTPPLVDVVDQLETLAALLSSGLLSDEDFDRQKRKVLARPAHGAR